MIRPTKRELRVAVITYYRRRARNPKITLREVCEHMGVNYQSVRNYKVLYDKTRKRGQKVQKRTDTARQDRSKDS